MQLLENEKDARNEAERANKTKDEFLAMLSHELRTPLTSILSWAQLLRSGKLDAEKTKHGIQGLEQSAKAQGQLIDDLLDISRIQAGKLDLEIQKVDPGIVISASGEVTCTRAYSLCRKRRYSTRSSCWLSITCSKTGGWKKTGLGNC